MRKFITLAILLTSIIGVESCTYDNEEDLFGNINQNCDTSNVSFANDILPIMNASCNITGCHDSQTQAAGLDLTGHAGTSGAGGNGTLVGRIKGIGGNLMPLGGTALPDCDISKIETWVADGAPNN